MKKMKLHGHARRFQNCGTILACLAVLVLCSAAGVWGGETGLSNALALVNQGKINEAIAVLHKEIEKNPRGPESYLLLGVAYLEKNEYVLAKNHLEKALALNPNSIPGHYTLAMLYEKERSYLKAVSEWTKVYQLSEDKNLKELANKHIRQMEGLR